MKNSMEDTEKYQEIPGKYQDKTETGKYHEVSRN